MKLQELKAKSATDLKKILAQKREVLRAGKFSVSAKQLKDVKAIKKTKRIIARILTILHDKEKESQKIVTSNQ